MIDGKKIIAFTPSGRARYMEILWRYVKRDHDRGLIDEWIVFNNAYNDADVAYTRALASRGSWIKVLEEPLVQPPPVSKPQMLGLDPRTRQRIWKRTAVPSRVTRGAGHISTFYKQMTESDCLYLRLDDDLVYVDPHAVERLARFKMAHPDNWLVYPTIINNTRMSYWLQQEGIYPTEWGELTNVFLEPTAWRSAQFAENIHRAVLPYAAAGNVSDTFKLADRELSNHAEPGVPDQQYAQGHVSVNSFIIDGKDMVGCVVPPDEEGYLSDFRPKALGRKNIICGDASVIHFAYHPQTVEMEATGLLQTYAAIAEKL